MAEQKLSRRYLIIMCTFTIIALLCGIFSYDGFNLQNWPSLVILTCLTLFLQTVTVSLTSSFDYSLSTATIFPVIYLFGITPASILSIIVAIADGLFQKKSWDRTLLNASQFVISAVACHLVFIGLGGLEVELWYGGLLALILGSLVYTSVNFLLVSFLVSEITGTTWRQNVEQIGFHGYFSSLGIDFVGILFTLFVIAYNFGGLLIFGALLIHLSGLLKVAVEISGERNIRRDLQEKLLIDEMTQTYNFRFLNNWLNSPVADEMAVLFMDIDNFKNFNDLYGHAEGDKVLRILAQTIKEAIRDDDMIIRYGGDEFVVFLPGQTKKEAQVVAERIMAKLKELPYKEQPITVSIGISASPEDYTDKRRLLMAADLAMYKAKALGKNVINLWTEQEHIVAG